MTQHVTIALDEKELDRARKLAEELGVSVEEYIQRLVRGSLPSPSPEGQRDEATSRAKVLREPTGSITDIFDLVDDGEPSDIAVDKDKMIGEAVWREHLRKTRQAE